VRDKEIKYFWGKHFCEVTFVKTFISTFKNMWQSLFGNGSLLYEATADTVNPTEGYTVRKVVDYCGSSDAAAYDTYKYLMYIFRGNLPNNKLRTPRRVVKAMRLIRVIVSDGRSPSHLTFRGHILAKLEEISAYQSNATDEDVAVAAKACVAALTSPPASGECAKVSHRMVSLSNIKSCDPSSEEPPVSWIGWAWGYAAWIVGATVAHGVPARESQQNISEEALIHEICKSTTIIAPPDTVDVERVVLMCQQSPLRCRNVCRVIHMALTDSTLDWRVVYRSLHLLRLLLPSAPPALTGYFLERRSSILALTAKGGCGGGGHSAVCDAAGEVLRILDPCEAESSAPNIKPSTRTVSVFEFMNK